ncbi:MAG: hypothetical protein IJZ87_08165 [Bacteroidales bacterium]|nr:hypothetical protein [Bacteroidales bacterium]
MESCRVNRQRTITSTLTSTLTSVAEPVEVPRDSVEPCPTEMFVASRKLRINLKNYKSNKIKSQ